MTQHSSNINSTVSTAKHKEFEIDTKPIENLRRCTRCVLPETMPFIEFDEDGVCNYCNTYQKHSYLGKDELDKWSHSHRSTKNEIDSMISFSGGRDSSYGMHYFVKELGLHPIAYSYDWGMVTDLAKRNQKLMCDALDVKLIQVTANIKKKRKNIRNNVVAWLKKPNLGMVPLFMAGDKQYYYYANKIKKEHHLETIQLAVNPFEVTHFKYGFCGIKPDILSKNEQSQKVERLKLQNIFKMSGHYLKQYITNPSYINSSLFDTLTATLSYYVIPHNYFRLFNYIQWNESEVNHVLLDEYGWETSSETNSTWRIGDGTAPFYNYIYYLVTGFTENDTLRSNQIREGMICREEALKLIYEENQPRFNDMKWYFDSIGLDMEDVLRQVNRIPKLYQE